MKPAQTTSPFQSLSKQEQNEKWLAWQSTHMQEKELIRDEPFTAKPLPPLKIPMVKEENPAFIPRHSQYDAVLNRMKNASKNLHELQP